MRQPSAPSMAHLAWITSISRYLQHPRQSHISTRARKPCQGCVLLTDHQKLEGCAARYHPFPHEHLRDVTEESCSKEEICFAVASLWLDRAQALMQDTWRVYLAKVSGSAERPAVSQP